MANDPSVSAEEPFSVLGNEFRTAILEVFAEAERDGVEALTFKDIYRDLSIDSTSQLSYHLDLLEGIFLSKDDDKYSLTQAGDRIVRAILSGRYAERPSFETTHVEGTCPSCGPSELRAEYHQHDLTVVCTDCNAPLVAYDLSPAEARNRTSRETLRSCDRRVHHEYATALRGTCSVCGGRTAVDIETDTDGDSTAVYSTARCHSCYRQVFAPLSVRLLYHPAVIAFYWRRGVDISSVPFWQIQEYIREWNVDVLDDDPFRARVTVGYEDEQVAMTVDGALDVELAAPQRSSGDD